MHANPFTAWLWPRRLPAAQLRVIAQLERQRRRYGCVRAYIKDDDYALANLLALYERYLQEVVYTNGGAIICTPRRLPIRFRRNNGRNIFRNYTPAALRGTSRWLDIPRVAATASLRSAPRIGFVRAATSLIVLGADLACPSKPLYDNHLDAIKRRLLPYIPNKGVVIIHGSTRNPRTPFARQYRALLSDTFWLTIDANQPIQEEALQKPTIIKIQKRHHRRPITRKLVTDSLSLVTSNSSLIKAPAFANAPPI